MIIDCISNANHSKRPAHIVVGQYVIPLTVPLNHFSLSL